MPSSDFTYVENVRVLNRLVRGVCQKATENIQAEVDPNDLEGSVKPMEAELNIPIEDAIRDKIISSGEVTIDTEDVNILVDETLNAHIEYADDGAATSTDIITNVKFSKRSLKAAQGDKSMKVDLDGFAVGGIKINGLDA